MQSDTLFPNISFSFYVTTDTEWQVVQLQEPGDCSNKFLFQSRWTNIRSELFFLRGDNQIPVCNSLPFSAKSLLICINFAELQFHTSSVVGTMMPTAAKSPDAHTLYDNDFRLLFCFCCTSDDWCESTVIRLFPITAVILIDVLRP